MIWFFFLSFFEEEINGVSFKLFLEKASVTIRTCLFKCGQCYNSLTECDTGTCKTNFAIYKDSDDQDCYPINQNFPNYIYDKTSNFFEKCYSTCIFCSTKNDNSSSSSHNCKVCEEGYLKSYRYLGNCYKIEKYYNNSQFFKNVNNINDENFTIVDSCNEFYMINDTGECVDSCPIKEVYYTYQYNPSINLSLQQENSLGLLYTLRTEKIPKYLFNKVCYINCPKNTQANTHNECQCKYGWHYNITTRDKICYEKDYCLSPEFYYHMDNKECVLNGCKDNYFQFNLECYESECPLNTFQISSDIKKCESNQDYCYIDNSFKTKCSNTPYEGYNLKYNNTKTYFKFCNESLYYFNLTTYLYKNICHINCPEGTTENDDNKRCTCNNYIYYINEEMTDYECFNSENECISRGLYLDRERKECYGSEKICINNNKKLFGKECINNCPINSEIKQNQNHCECSYYFYNNNGILNCFNSNVKCEDEGYPITTDIKECFSSIDDCFSNNYLYYYDKTCYLENCPQDKISLNSMEDSMNKTRLIEQLSLKESLISKLCICDTKNYYHGWINKNTSDPSLQQCLNECPKDYDLDPTTQKCYYFCDPHVDFVFNDICYKNYCPESTHLDPSNTDSHQCVCEGKAEIDQYTNLTKCVDIYPEEFYKDSTSCPYFYKDTCYSKCPENTCISANNVHLAKCIDFRPNQMKIYNGICIEGIDNLVSNIIDNDNDNDYITPIITPSGVAISAISTDVTMNDFIEKNPDLTFVDLGECQNKLREAYKLPPDMKMYIIGIDSPNLYGNSSINAFDYEIYLKNGTKIDDISPCYNTKILVSSSIKDLESINYNKAQDFYKEGYDIYNKSNLFYNDVCSPAQDDGNDITLEDRSKYYYPNVSICNEGCEYNVVDFNTQRFLCDCNANLTDKKEENKKNEEKKDEDDSSYLDYFLSLINYKIFLCMNLFFEFKSFYYNAGFYISFCTMLICIILMILFLAKGINYIKVLIYKNIPTKEKLKELIEKNKKKLRDHRKNVTLGINELKFGENKISSNQEILNQGDDNNFFWEERTSRKMNDVKYIPMKDKMSLNISNNPPPKPKTKSEILSDFTKARNKKKNRKKEKEINDDINQKNIEIFDISSSNDIEKKKESSKKMLEIFGYKKDEETSKVILLNKNVMRNKLNNEIHEKSKEQYPRTLLTGKGDEDNNKKKNKKKNN